MMAESEFSGVAIGVRFGDFVALKDVSFDIRKGSVHSFIGPNGAGKTTLFNCLAGRVRPVTGRVTYRGVDITAVPVHKRVRLGIGRSFQVTNLFPEMTVRESLRVAAQGQVRGASFGLFGSAQDLKQTLATAEAVMERIGLQRWSAAKSGELSHGQQRRLEIGLALACSPSTILLDEPTAGMGVDDIAAIKELITSLARTMTIVLVEHNMNVVLDISDTVTVLQLGTVLTEGPPSVIRSDPRVKAAYLGRRG
jgi:branched-chain amino acid transport system ATP-binding protein